MMLEPQAGSRTKAWEQEILNPGRTAQPEVLKQEGGRPLELKLGVWFWVSEPIAGCPKVSEFGGLLLGCLPAASREVWESLRLRIAYQYLLGLENKAWRCSGLSLGWL